MKYLVLQITTETNLPVLHFVEQNDVDDIVGLTEASFTDFPIEEGSRQLQDNQYDYFVYSIKNRNDLFAKVNQQIAQCEAFFDDLQDPANPTDHKMYDHVGHELDEWIGIRTELQSLG